MQAYGAQIRWIKDQCYEIILPNDKHLVIDPGLSTAVQEDGTRPADVFDGVDYILLTHTHAASAAAIGYLCEKFHPKLFLGAGVAAEVAKYFDLDYTLICPVSHGQKYKIDECEITGCQGRHAGSNLKRERLLHISDKLSELPGYGELDVLGNVENLDYYITLPNHLRIAFISGEDFNADTYANAEKFQANIVIRAAVRGWSKEHFAKAIYGYGGQIAFPSHHDVVFRRDQQAIQEFITDTRNALADMGAYTTLVNPVSQKWYSLSMCVEEI